MPKMKTSKTAAKRFKFTGTGKLRRQQSMRQHLFEQRRAILMREQIGGPAVSLLGTLLAALTTWLSFGLLALSSTPAVSNFGLSVSLGLAFSFMLAPWAGQRKHAS